MLRRFAPLIVIACLVLASLGVWVWWEIMPEPYVDPRAARSCAELFSLYSAPYRPTMSPALSTTMQLCDNSVHARSHRVVRYLPTAAIQECLL
jgi:hypothetical protein